MLQRMYVDIETSLGLYTSWRIGRNITLSTDNVVWEPRIVCIAWNWEGSDTVEVYHWDKRKNDKALLKKFFTSLRFADEVVAHNGKRFDVRWIRARAAIHGMDMPPMPHVTDTLKIAREGFLFHSNKAAYLAKRLGVLEKGNPPFDLWHKVSIDNNQLALIQMVNYCAQDVKVLKDIYHRLMKYTEPQIHAGLVAGVGKDCCPSCVSDNVQHHKKLVTKAGSIKHRMQCRDCKVYFVWSNQTLYMYMNRKAA